MPRNPNLPELDETLTFLYVTWKKLKSEDRATPGFRKWLHDAGIQTPDDLADIKRFEVQWPEPREDLHSE